MAVYTDISEEELSAFLADYPVGGLLSYKGMSREARIRKREADIKKAEKEAAKAAAAAEKAAAEASEPESPEEPAS